MALFLGADTVLEAQTPQLTAEQAVAEAETLKAQKSADAHRRAIAKYDAAITIWRELGETIKEIKSLNEAGTIYRQMGEGKRSLEYHSRAIELARGVRNKELEAQSLLRAGQAHDVLGQVRTEQELYKQALAISREISNKKIELDALSGIAYTHYMLGELQRTIDYYNETLPFYRALSDKDGEITVLVNIGAVYIALGDPKPAIGNFLKALALVRELDDPQREAIILNNIGTGHSDLGDHAKSIEFFGQSLALRRKVGDRRGEAVVLGSLAASTAKIGDSRKALELYQQALAIQRELKIRRSEGNTLSNIARVYLSLNEPAKAVEHYRLALPIRREAGDIYGESITLHGLAAALFRIGDHEEALRYIGQAVDIVESVRSTLASQSLRESFFALSQDMYKLQIDVLMSLHTKRPGEGFDRKGLAISERARARSLVDLLSEAKAGINAGIDPVLAEREKKLRKLLGENDEARKRTNDEKEAARIDAEIDKLSAAYKELQAEVRVKNPRYAALTQPRLPAADDIQGLLDADTLLVEYSLGETASYAWTVTREGTRSYKLANRAEIEQAAREVYALISDSDSPPDFDNRLSKLSSLLIGTFAKDFVAKRIVVVPDGILHYIPFAALSKNADGAPLIQDHEIVTVPSAATLAAIRVESRTGRKPINAVAIFADPVFDAGDTRVLNRSSQPPPADKPLIGVTQNLGFRKSLPRLPGTRREAASIMSLAGLQPKKQFLDFAANLDAVAGPDAAGARIVHFATHGLIDSRHPELSGVVLSLIDKAGKPQNGYLRLSDIYALDWSADTVVLSACKTALGQEVKGEGLVGITRGFMYAGAKRVVASLWSVDDEGTAELMRLFYENMLEPRKLAAPAALRAAQLTLYRSRSLAAPYYWAAFTIQGDWK